MTVDTATAALMARYDQATDDQKRRGRLWYREALRAVNRISRETGVTSRRVAAVLAVTSPDTQLKSNLAWTHKACSNGGQTAGKYPTAQLPKVRAALHGKRPSAACGGPKVEAFYRAVTGDREALVIDRWAAYAAGHPRDRAIPRKAREALTEAYRAVAEATGETVRDLQAIVWIQTRETTPDSRGRIKRYEDITR